MILHLNLPTMLLFLPHQLLYLLDAKVPFDLVLDLLQMVENV